MSTEQPHLDSNPDDESTTGSEKPRKRRFRDPDKANGDGFTLGTRQGYEIELGHRAPGYYTTDAEEMRQRRFDFPPLDAEAFQKEKGSALSGVYPDMLIHTDDPSAPDVPSTVSTDGATLAVVEAPMGSGKSTLIDQWCIYQMARSERIVRNGRQKTSEWRRCKDWATLWLPDSVDISTRWLEAVDREPPDVDELARHVRYYTDVRDLVDQLQDHPRGTYNIVYPDPLFRKCEAVLDAVDAAGVQSPTFRPKGVEDATPASNWWFAFIVARVLYGDRRDENNDPNWMNLHLDELRALAPENPAGGDEGHWLYECIEIVSEISIETRKAGLSIYGYTQKAEKTAHEWVSEFTHWAELAKEGRSNRITKGEAPPPFRSLPQDTDLLGSRPLGFGLAYNGDRFSEFQWSDLGFPTGFPEFALELGVPESAVAATTESGLNRDGIVVEDSVLTEYRTSGDDVHELRVRSPGRGRIDLTGDRPTIEEELVSPFDGTSFLADPLCESETEWTLVWSNGSETITVARLPKAGQSASVGTEVIDNG